MAVEVGQRIGDYEILDLLGAGGMGRVYRVRNVISDRIDAMKILLPDLSAEPDLAARFTAEIRTLASFDHPNIAQLRTAFTYDDQLVMIMEFVEGVTLGQRARRSALSIDEVLDYASQVLSALSYAHGRGVIHRDIKPANMMVTSHGILKLMDFGIAKSATEMQLTRTGTTIGSLYYMSPEQVRGVGVDARSDIYSVGITLYELLTGRRPFQADTTYTVLDQQLNAPPQPPIELNPNLPQGLNDVILMALSKDPDHRFQTADAFQNALKHSVKPADPAQQVVAASAAASPPTPSLVEPSWQPVTPGTLPGLPQPGAAKPPTLHPVAAKSRRGLWMGLGAVAALLALIFAATVLPNFVRTRAGSQAATPSAPTASGSAPAKTAAVSEPPAPVTTVEGTPPPAVTSGGSSAGTPTAPPTTRTSAPNSAAGNPAKADVPASTKVTPAVEPVTPAGPSAQEAADAGEQLMQLDSRASAVKATISQIEREQEASGVGMRSDIVASQSRMNSYLQNAERALRMRDLQSAKSSMEKAEKEISTLETFIGK